VLIEAERFFDEGGLLLRRALVAVAATLAVVLAGGPAQAAPAPGAPGIGDPYFPEYGNGGYDVSHYDIRLRYYPDTDRLTGTTTILARSTQELNRFNLDFILPTSSVRVNGWSASFVRQGDHELVVTPQRTIARNQFLTIVVQYDGVPSDFVAAGYTAWTRTPDGALAIGQPEIAWWWFPSNDHPLDKATWDVSVLVPDGVEVLSNGIMPRAPRRELVGWTRWSWRSARPGQTYMPFLAIGQYEIVQDVAPSGQQVINAYSDNLAEYATSARASVERTAEVVEWLSGVIGPYPFEAQGGVVVAPGTLGFALENQTRSTYAAEFFRRGSDPYVVVHENAHQWFGDSVALEHWDDIWLHEGFATYLEWLWSEYTGEGTAQEVFDFTYAFYPQNSAFWTVKPGDPGAANIFNIAVYDRGAMTLHQLRLAIGDGAFFELVRTWAATYKYGNANQAQFHALAEQISGQDLDALFNTWLFTASRPVLAASAARAGTNAPSAAAEPKSWAKMHALHEALVAAKS
jgi:aminopeptidase N